MLSIVLESSFTIVQQTVLLGIQFAVCRADTESKISVAI